MLLADYLLFSITAVLLLATASFVGLRVYQNELGTLFVSSLLSGFPIIALGYAIGLMFSNKD